MRNSNERFEQCHVNLPTIPGSLVKLVVMMHCLAFRSSNHTRTSEDATKKDHAAAIGPSTRHLIVPSYDFEGERRLLVTSAHVAARGNALHL